MVLLRVLHDLMQEHGWRLTVAHFNHQLRGRSSDADERFVRQTAERWGIPFTAGHADKVIASVPSSTAVKAFARQHNLSLEMAARRLRHDFLARTARQQKTPTIALGHHADDQVELFFLRLLRGTGSDGLAGMKWCGPSPVEVRSSAFRRIEGARRSDRLKAELRTQLVRPLLYVSRAQLEQSAHENKI